MAENNVTIYGHYGYGGLTLFNCQGFDGYFDNILCLVYRFFLRGDEVHSVGGTESGGSGDGFGEGGGSGHWVGASHGRDGQWTAMGDDRSGTITLSYHNGERVVIEYTVSENPKDMSGFGPAVYFGGELV